MRLKALSIGIIVVALALTVHSQTKLSPNSALLERLRKSIALGSEASAKRDYLRHFPKTCSRFKKTFDDPKFGELYSSYEEHMTLLESLNQSYPRTVRSIWFGIARNCAWEADAVGEVQHQLANFGARDTKTFARDLNSKPRRDRLSIIRFLADVENHKAYSSYQIIERNLKSLGYSALSAEFARAKAKRIKEKDHAF